MKKSDRQPTGLAAVLITLLFLAAPAAGAECTPEQGQLFIDQGRFDKAIREFSCVIDAAPTDVEGYRGRIEAELLAGRYSDAVRDYALVTAFVEPVHPDAEAIITEGYADRLAAAPADIHALTGASFAAWWFFDYPAAIRLTNRLLAVVPDDVYGNLFRGSSRMLSSAMASRGAADLEKAIALAPTSPDVRFIVADAYTYGQPDPTRAFAEASAALGGGLNTPRIHAILGAAYLAFGDLVSAGAEIETHIELVTNELVTTGPLAEGGSFALDLVPGRTYEIPVPVVAGQTLSIVTGSHDFTDTILALVAPDDTPVLGSDDVKGAFAAFKWVAASTGTYRLHVTSFEGVNTGVLIVTRH